MRTLVSHIITSFQVRAKTIAAHPLSHRFIERERSKPVSQIGPCTIHYHCACAYCWIDFKVNWIEESNAFNSINQKRNAFQQVDYAANSLEIRIARIGVQIQARAGRAPFLILDPKQTLLNLNGRSCKYSRKKYIGRRPTHPRLFATATHLVFLLCYLHKSSSNLRLLINISSKTLTELIPTDSFFLIL